MSYDITNYAMLAISLPDFIETLNKDIKIPLETNADYVVLDKKFDVLLKESPEAIRNSEFDTAAKIADLGFTETNGHSYKGPKIALISALPSGAGLSNPIFFDSESCNLVSHMAWKPKIFPRVLLKHLSSEKKLDCESLVLLGGDRLNDVLAMISTCLYKLGKINLVDGKVKDENGFDLEDEDGNTIYTFTIPCFKTAIEDLFSLYKDTVKEKTGSHLGKLDAIHYWMQYIINLYVGTLGFDEEMEVESTNFGVVHDFGGMEEDIPYISIRGLQSYDEDGWTNPRDEDSDFVRDLENAIVQDSGKEFSVFTPQFGG
jgi:hypothetical protein